MIGSKDFIDVCRAWSDLFDVEPSINLSFEHRSFEVSGEMYCWDLPDDTSLKNGCSSSKIYTFYCDPFVWINEGTPEEQLAFRIDLVWDLYRKAAESIEQIESGKELGRHNL